MWTEAALLHDAVEKVSLLFTEWQAALAHAVSVHHHPTSQGNVDPLQLYAKTGSLPTVAQKRHAREESEEVEPDNVPLSDGLGEVGSCNLPSTAPPSSSEHTAVHSRWT